MLGKSLFNAYAKAPAKFRADLLVDVDGVARRFSDVEDDWQHTDFRDLDPALLRVTGRSKAHCRMRAYWERGRGHDKTSGIATEVIYLLSFANRPLRGYCFAADKDQAKLLKDAVATKIRLNPWLGTILEVQKDQVVNKAVGHPGNGGKLEIFTSDVGSSYGILPDFIVADELTHWQGDGSLWHSIISSAAKRSSCLMLVIANAGFCDSWQWNVREAIRQDPNWIFSRLDGPVASWITEDRLQEQQRLLPAIAYARLWLNQWSSGGGDALPPSVVEAAFRDNLQPMTGHEPGWQFVGGVDLGLTRDCSAVIILGTNPSGIIRLANARLWKPTPGHKINIAEIEQTILTLDSRYRLRSLGIDPWQAEHLGQRLEALTSHRRRNARRFHWAEPWIKMLPPTAANLRDMAGMTIESFQDGRIRCYPYEPLKQDLLKLRVEEKSYGIRLVSPRDGDGHGDSFSAFANALLIAHALAGKKPVKAGLSKDTRSPLERAMARMARHEAYVQQQESQLAQIDDDQQPFIEFMRKCGRI